MTTNEYEDLLILANKDVLLCNLVRQWHPTALPQRLKLEQQLIDIILR